MWVLFFSSFQHVNISFLTLFTHLNTTVTSPILRFSLNNNLFLHCELVSQWKITFTLLRAKYSFYIFPYLWRQTMKVKCNVSNTKYNLRIIYYFYFQHLQEKVRQRSSKRKYFDTCVESNNTLAFNSSATGITKIYIIYCVIAAEFFSEHSQNYICRYWTASSINWLVHSYSVLSFPSHTSPSLVSMPRNKLNATLATVLTRIYSATHREGESAPNHAQWNML